MELKNAKEELEYYGNKMFYYNSIKRSVSSIYNTQNDMLKKQKQLNIERLANELTEIEVNLCFKIEKLASPYNALLYHKFILLMKADELSNKFSYSPQHIRRLIDKGIEEFAKILN